MNVNKLLLALSIAAALSACGGGGGGGGGAGSSSGGVQPPVSALPPPPPVTPPPVTPLPYTLSPAVLSASYVTGFPTTLRMEARQTVPFTGITYMKVTAAAPFDPRFNIAPQSDGTFRITVDTVAETKPGRYTGNVDVSVCSDANCGSHLAGSPFKYPYDIEVRSAESTLSTQNLSALTLLPGASDWATFQGNAQHTGYVPVTLSPASFSARWKWSPASPGGVTLAPSAIATGGGRIYSSTGTTLRSEHAAVYAINEHDGTLAWRHPLTDLTFPSTNPPAYADGKVYAVVGSQESTALLSLVAASGQQVVKTPMTSQWGKYLAPIVVNGTVYTNGGQHGGLYGIKALNGAQQFFTNSLGSYDGWSPAYDGSQLYAYVRGALKVIDPVTGNVSASISDTPYDWYGDTINGAPVIGASGLVFAGNFYMHSGQNAIVAFDPVAKTMRWSAKGWYAGNPAHADGTLFAVNNANGQLEALRETDGVVSWSWKNPVPGSIFVGAVLLTKNLVFVSTDTAVYAIDRGTRQQVWTFNGSGKLAMSANGILYITNDMGITAINLR